MLLLYIYQCLFQHTAARRRLDIDIKHTGSLLMFQHTAARRRLDINITSFNIRFFCFNTQPPEGGWTKTQTQ